jgi:hypothetical protein
MNAQSESTPLLPSFHPTHRKNTAPTIPGAIYSYFVWVLVFLARLFSRQTFGPVLPAVAPSAPQALNISSSRVTLGNRPNSTTQSILPQDSTLVVITRSEFPSTTYPTSSLKKAPSYDSILPMKEPRSVRFSAIIDILEFSRLPGEPIGTMPVSLSFVV